MHTITGDVSVTPALESMVPTLQGASSLRRASEPPHVSGRAPSVRRDAGAPHRELPGARPEVRVGRAARRGIRLTLLLLIATGAGVFAAWEMRTFCFQAYLFHSAARDAAFEVRPGAASWDLPAPSGPYDRRIGYRTCAVHRRARRARLRRGRAGPLERGARADRPRPLPDLPGEDPGRPAPCSTSAAPSCSRRAFPGAIYPSFDAVPPVVVEVAALHREPRAARRAPSPRRNPAVEWARLGRASRRSSLKIVDRDYDAPGGSTLATQIEKYRHSPSGRHRLARRQAAPDVLGDAARLFDGPGYARLARRQIVLDYLNTVPLAARARRYGEVDRPRRRPVGVVRRRFRATMNRLRAPAASARRTSPLKARAYQQVLACCSRSAGRPITCSPAATTSGAQPRATSALLAARRHHRARTLRDAALAQKLEFLPDPPPAAERALSSGGRRPTPSGARRLATMLGRPASTTLDRLDLEVETTLDRPTQERVDRAAQGSASRRSHASVGLYGTACSDAEHRQRAADRTACTLYERGRRATVCARRPTTSTSRSTSTRAPSSSSARPPSCARSITYLEIIAALHERSASGARRELAGPADQRARPADPLGADYLAEHTAPGLADDARRSDGAALFGEPVRALLHRRRRAPLLELRSGGRRPRADRARRRCAHSVNLAFIRMMRDVVDHYVERRGSSPPRCSPRPADDSRRRAYLSRFADRRAAPSRADVPARRPLGPRPRSTS